MSYAIQYNNTVFRAMFPAFADATTYPDDLLLLYWNTATAYISKWPQCDFDGFTLAQQTLALNDMTAHLAQLQTMANAGQQGGIVTGAGVGAVNVSLLPPPVEDQWAWWLNQTPYGAALLALLEVVMVGGIFIGDGVPARGMFLD